MLQCADGNLILANNSGKLQYLRGYNALNFGYFCLHALHICGVRYSRGQSLLSSLGESTFGYVCGATKVNLAQFGVLTAADLVSLATAFHKTQPQRTMKLQASLASAKGLPSGQSIVGWPSAVIALCEVETVMANQQKQHKRASPDELNRFLVHVALKWSKSGQSMDVIQDVHGQSVASIQVSHAVESLGLHFPCGQSIRAATPRDVALALVGAGVIQKVHWHQTLDLVEAMAVVWASLNLGYLRYSRLHAHFVFFSK